MCWPNTNPQPEGPMFPDELNDKNKQKTRFMFLFRVLFSDLTETDLNNNFFDKYVFCHLLIEQCFKRIVYLFLETKIAASIIS